MPNLDAKQVRLIMSFGGEDDSSAREAALTYWVVKNILEQCAQGIGVSMDVKRCIKYAGEISPAIFDEIAKADAVVAILDRMSSTVAFELAFRSTLRGQVILVAPAKEALPFYLKDWAYVNLSEELRDAIRGEAADESNFPDLSFESCPLSPLLEKLLKDAGKNKLPLCRALDEVIASRPSPCPFFEEDVLPLLRKRIISTDENYEDYMLGPWAKASYYPLSILKIDFLRMSDTKCGLYDPDDVAAGPTVVDANHGFAKFFNLSLIEGEDVTSQLRRKNPLNFKALMERLSGGNGVPRLAHPDWDQNAFEKDQERLRKWVLFYYPDGATDMLCPPGPSERDVYACEPIRLSDDHPAPEMRGESFLPCLIAKRHGGDFPGGPHSVFLRIAFIDVTRVGGGLPSLKGAPLG